MKDMLIQLQNHLIHISRQSLWSFLKVPWEDWLGDPPMNYPVKLVFVSWQENSFLSLRTPLKAPKPRKQILFISAKWLPVVPPQVSIKPNRPRQQHKSQKAVCTTVPNRALKTHRKQITELSWAYWNTKLKKNLSLCQSPVPKSLKPFGPHFVLQVSLTCGQHIIIEERSAHQVFQVCFFFPEMVKSRLICTDTLASPCLPIYFSTDFMRHELHRLPDFYGFICNIYHVPFPVWACLLQCQCLPGKVKVILWLHRWLPCSVCWQWCPLVCHAAPCNTSQGFLITCPALHILPSAVTRLGSSGETEKKVLILHLMTPLLLSVFFVFCKLSEGVIQKTVPASAMDTAQIKNLLSSTHKKIKESRKEHDTNDEETHSPKRD